MKLKLLLFSALLSFNSATTPVVAIPSRLPIPQCRLDQSNVDSWFIHTADLLATEEVLAKLPQGATVKICITRRYKDRAKNTTVLEIGSFKDGNNAKGFAQKLFLEVTGDLSVSRGK